MYFGILLFVTVPFWCHLPPPPPPPTLRHTHISHTHTDLASMLRLPLVAQRGAVKLSSVPFLYRAALSCSISLLTQSCHGLRGLKMGTQRSKKWNSKNKPLIYSSACMLMSACIYICETVFEGRSMAVRVEISADMPSDDSWC